LRRSVAPLAQRASLAIRPPAPLAATSNGDERKERTLVSLMLRYPPIVRDFQSEPESRHWISERWRETVDLITREWQEHGEIDVERIAQSCAPDKASEIAALVLEGESFAETEAKAAADCLNVFRQKHEMKIRRKKGIEIRTAEEKKDEQAKRERTLEWEDVKKRQQDRQRLVPKIPPR
jgi:hypothetical protein